MRKEILHQNSLVKFAALCMFLSLNTTFLFAARNQSSLQLSLWNNKPLYVQIDGEHYQSAKLVSIDNLEGGQHYLKVFGMSVKPQGNQNKVLLFEGKIMLADYTSVIARINQNKKYEVIREVPIRTEAEQCPVLVQARPAHGGCQKPDQHHQRPRPDCSGHHDDVYQNDNNYDYDDHYEDDHCNDNQDDGSYTVVWRSFTDQGVNAVVSTLDNIWNDDDRLVVAVQALNEMSITTDQAIRIASEFWYEKNKLGFLKEVYSHITDKGNFYKVNELLWYSSSIRELNDYIQSQNKMG